MSDTTNLALPRIEPAQAQKHVTHNEALDTLDALVQLTVLDRDLTSPPGSPTDGARYLIASGATGVWASKDLKIAMYVTGAWKYFTPKEGWVAWVADEDVLLIFNGSTWVNFTVGLGIVSTASLSDGTITQIGVNTTSSSTNRLAVRSNAALFTALYAANSGNGDFQVIVNKEADSDVASFLLQKAFSGRAEIGLIGDNNFSFKMSPDGSTFTSALILKNSDATAYAPIGLSVGVSASTALPASTLLHVRGSGSSGSAWVGRAVFGGANASVLCGEYASGAWVAGHNTALSAWQDLFIQPDGAANLIIGNLGSAKVGIGLSSPSARLHVLSTTEQFRFGYDVNNYLKATCDNTGLVTVDGAGSGSGIKFVMPVGFYNTNPIAKQTITGSRGGNAAVAAIATALENLGLLTNLTSA